MAVLDVKFDDAPESVKVPSIYFDGEQVRNLAALTPALGAYYLPIHDDKPLVTDPQIIRDEEILEIAEQLEKYAKLIRQGEVYPFCVGESRGAIHEETEEGTPQRFRKLPIYVLNMWFVDASTD